jgi:hypothetical protein
VFESVLINVTKESEMNLYQLINEKKNLTIEITNIIKNNKIKDEESQRIIESQDFHIKQLNS